MSSLLAEGTLAYKKSRGPFPSALSELPSHPSVPASTSPGASTCVAMSWLGEALCGQGLRLIHVSCRGRGAGKRTKGKSAPIKGRKEKERNGQEQTVCRSIAERDTSVCIFPSRQGKPFAVIPRGRCWKRRLPCGRSALRSDGNTRLWATVSIFVPSRKGYFCLNFEGLPKAGTLEALGLSESGRF